MELGPFHACYNAAGYLFGGTNATDSGAAVRAFTLRDGFAVFRGSLDGILHDLLCLALHAVCLNSHGCLQT